MRADVGFLDLERDLRLDLVFLKQTRAEDGAGKENVHVNAIHYGLELQQFSETCINEKLLAQNGRQVYGRGSTLRMANFPGEYGE